MSRLQKKKPQSEKRKRVVETTDDETGVAVKSTVERKPGRSVSDGRPEKPGQLKADNIFVRTTEFFREVKVELKKVVWPTRNKQPERRLWSSFLYSLLLFFWEFLIIVCPNLSKLS